MLPFHERLARVGLEVTEQFGFVLAGGYAVSANGMGQRLSQDVDLFTNRSDTHQFAQAVDALQDAYRRRLGIGLVLDAKDAVANKTAALYSRGETRDFIDVDTVVQSGRFTREEIIALGDSREVEPMDRTMLTTRFREVAHHAERAFAAYGVGSAERSQIVERFARWADAIDSERATDRDD